MAEATRVTIGGHALRCRHCDHNEFEHKTASLDRMAAQGWFHLEGVWGHQTAMYVCVHCGCVELFMEVTGTSHQIEEATSQATQPKIPAITSRRPMPDEACLACGTRIASEAIACPQCGWTWEDADEVPS